MFLLYVDDIVLTTYSFSLLCHLIQLLKDEFSMTDICSLRYFLSVQVQNNLSGLFLFQ